MSGLKRRVGRILAAAALAACFGAAPVLAKDVELSKENVQRFLDSFSEMEMLAISEGLKTGMDAKANGNALTAVLKVIQSGKLQSEAQAIAVNHGFKALKDWAATGQSIAQAYIYVTAGSSRTAAKAQIDQNKHGAAKEIEKLGFLSNKAKQKLKENLDHASEDLSREPPPQNVAIVKEMKPTIEATVKLPGK